MYSRFSKDTIKAFTIAKTECQKLKSPILTTEHLLLGILQTQSIITNQIFKENNIDILSLRKYITNSLDKNNLLETTSKTNIFFSPRVYSILEGALIESELLNHFHIGTEHLILSLCQEEDSKINSTLVSNFFKIKPNRLRALIYKNINEFYPFNFFKKNNSKISQKNIATAAWRQKYFLKEIEDTNEKLCKFYSLRLLKDYTNERLIIGLRDGDIISYRKRFNLNGNVKNLFS